MSQRKSGVALILALAVLGGSIALLMEPRANICANRPSLAILATVAAFVLVLSVRLLGLKKEGRLLLLISALLAIAAFLVDIRFVVVHRTECRTAGTEQQSQISPARRAESNSGQLL